MTVEDIRSKVEQFIDRYSITKVVLFGSRANGTNTDESDVDLIIEFSKNVSLITLSQLKYELEEALGVGVDIIHGPTTEDDMIEVEGEVILYAA